MDNPEAPDLYDDRQEDDLLALMNEGDDQESISGGWILTYADLITVLLVLFVMLQTLSDFNVEKFNVLFYGAF